MKTFRSRSLCLALLALSVSAFAQTPASAPKASTMQRLSSPYNPGEVVQAVYDTTDEWVEIYDNVSAARAESVIAQVVDKGQAPRKGLGFVLAGSLYAKLDGRERTLPEVRTEASREGKPVEYVKRCGVFPKSGDRVKSTYSSGEDVIELDVTVRRYLPYTFLELSEKLVPIDPANPKQCASQTHTRIFLQGTLRLLKAGAVQESRQVLVQSIYEPS